MTHVVTAFVRHRGEVLLAKRSDEVGTYRGLWGGVSGYVEGDPRNAATDARRELAEEVGLRDVELVRAGDPLPVADGDREWTVHPFLFELREGIGSATVGDDAAEEGSDDATDDATGDDATDDDATGGNDVTGDATGGDTTDGNDATGDDEDTSQNRHPDVTRNYELVAAEWVQPPEILARETVPALWATYRRVAPTVADVRENETHGSAYVSLRALEVLRDAAAEASIGDDAGEGASDRDRRADSSEDTGSPEASGADGRPPAPDGWAGIAAVARDLRDARPSMAALANRVNRAMAEADRTPAAVLARTREAIRAAADADDRATAAAADLLRERLDGCEVGAGRNGGDDGEAVLTLSRSGTVADALLAAAPPVVVAESRPDREGIDTAERLAAAGLDVTVATDAAAVALVGADADRDADGVDADRSADGTPTDAEPTPRIGAVLVGADAVLPDGAVANKTGTFALGAAADRAGAPLYAVAARDKVSPDPTFRTERGDPADVYDGDRDVAVANPIFDRTPPDLVGGIVTEEGVLDADDIAAVAAEHGTLTEWDREGDGEDGGTGSAESDGGSGSGGDSRAGSTDDGGSGSVDGDGSGSSGG